MSWTSRRRSMMKSSQVRKTATCITFLKKNWYLDVCMCVSQLPFFKCDPGKEQHQPCLREMFLKGVLMSQPHKQTWLVTHCWLSNNLSCHIKQIDKFLLHLIFQALRVKWVTWPRIWRHWEMEVEQGWKRSKLLWKKNWKKQTDLRLWEEYVRTEYCQSQSCRCLVCVKRDRLFAGNKTGEEE